MKAVITDGDGSLRLVDDVPEPSLGPYDCRVKTEAFAFCNATDGYIVDTKPPLHMQYPAVLGHESVGVITQLGAKVKSFRLGDRVLRPYAAYPGDSLNGFHTAWGGFAEITKVCDLAAMRDDGLADEAHALRHMAYQQHAPTELTPVEALLMIPWKEMHSALDGVAEIAGRRFAVTGAGIVAFCFGYLLRKRGAAHVTLIARRRDPLEKAQALGGADSVLLSEEPASATEPFDAMIETTGSIAFAKSQLPRLRPGGEVYAYAIYPQMGEDGAFADFERSHRFSRIDPREAEADKAVCDLVRERGLPFRDLITHEFDIRDIQQAWQTVTERRTLKTVVHF